MRKIITNLLLAGLFLITLFIPKPALASYEDPVPPGQLILENSYIDVSSFHCWKHSDGRWQDNDSIPGPDMPGQVKEYDTPNITRGLSSDKYDITGVRIRFLTPAQWDALGGPALYEKYHGYGNLTYDEFKNFILRYMVSGGEEGEVRANYTPGSPSFSLHFIYRLSGTIGVSDLEAAKVGAMDLKQQRNIDFLYRIGYPLPTPPKQFLQAAEGWGYWIPYIVEVYGVPKKPAPDMYVKALDPGTSEVIPGNAYTGKVVFGLASDYQTPVQGTLTLTNNGYPVPGVDGQTVTFNPGEEKSFNFTFHGDAGGCKLVAKIHPVDPPTDKDWSNNTKEVNVPAKEVPKPGPGELTFQAYSQEGQDVYGNTVPSMPREPNTAKWTDTIKATLRPPAPVPPRGTLDWWKITSAKLTYPKKHPEFTFGHPLEPVGTITIDMTPNGHEATAEFREDWSLNGAPIYDVLEDRMVPGPTEYTITAEYTIEYQYHYTECDETGCWTVTETAATSGSASGKLLVNGTGVNSL